MDYEITKMLAAGTGSISKSTADMLDREADDNALCLSVYKKTSGGERYGWFIYMPRTLPEAAPGDLSKILDRAFDTDCGAVCLDSDGPAMKMLTASTGHVSKSTADLLDLEADDSSLKLEIYRKTGSGEQFGWFIYVPKALPGNAPRDLTAVLALAIGTGCDIVCLDGDGPEYPGLEVFDW